MFLSSVFLTTTLVVVLIISTSTATSSTIIIDAEAAAEHHKTTLDFIRSQKMTKHHYHHHHHQNEKFHHVENNNAFPEICNETMVKKGLQYCNQSLSLNDRIDDFVNRISFKDQSPAAKVWWLFGNTQQGLDEPYFPKYQVWSEGLHGVADSPGVHWREPTPHATSFPQVSLTGATMNKQLFREIGDTIGKEGRAMNNVGNAGLSFWAPNINRGGIFPTWGRAQETPGDSLQLTATYAANFIRGAQNNSMDPTRLRVSFCAKHQVGYDLENSNGYTRHNFNAVFASQDAFDQHYSMQFEAAMKPGGGGSSGMMSSYNAETIIGNANVQNLPSSANKEWLTETLRKKWGGDFYATSDCGAVQDIFDRHKYVKTPEEAAALVIKAGLNSDCGGVLTTALPIALNKSLVTEQDLRETLKPLFRTFFRLGMFDSFDSQPYKTLGPKDVDTPAARQLAYQAAVEGITLLKHNPRTFPLDPKVHKKIAVVGPHFNASTAFLGNYYGNPPFVRTPIDGLSKYAADVVTAQGCPLTDFDQKGFPEACSLVADPSVDAVIMMMGIGQSVAAEGHDRTDIAFPGLQNLFIREMSMKCAQKKKPIIVVTLSGSTLDYLPILNVGVDALLWSGYPGQSGGDAIADIIYGKVSPSGRISHDVFANNYIYEVSPLNMQIEADDEAGFPGRGNYYTGKDLLFEFGQGETFGNFSVELLSVSSVSIPSDLSGGDRPRTLVPICELVFKVTNSPQARMASKFSLLLHAKHNEDKKLVRAPMVDFAKTSKPLAPAESENLQVSIHLATVLTQNGSAVKSGNYRWFVRDSDQEGEIFVP